MESSTSSKIISVSKPNETMHVFARRIPRLWQWRLFVGCLILIDTLAVGLAFRIAYFIRFELSINAFQLDANPSPSFYQTLVFFLIPGWLVLFAFFGLYDRRNLLGGTIEYARVFRAATTGMILVIFANFVWPKFILARGWLTVSWILSFFVAAGFRFLFRRVVYQFRTRGYFLAPAIIVGANSEGRSLAEQLTRWKTSGLDVIGFVDNKLPVETPVYHQMQVLGSVDQLKEIISCYAIEELIVASSSITGRDRMMGIFQRYGIASQVNVRISSGLYEIITTGLTVKEFAYVPLVGINKVRLTGVDRFLKLILDYCVAVPVLVLSSPFLAIIALAIKLDSRGGVIYRRRVLGLHGRQFDAFKFRTMHANGDEILAAYPELESELAQNYKIKDDPRVTRLGKFLRKFSLDELPQFVNVLRREMSVVGPRMITPEEIEQYDKWHLNLLTVRPGITGYWQVNGRSDVSYEDRVRLDMHYIRNWSIWFDLQLLVQTIPAVLRRRGAY